MSLIQRTFISLYAKLDNLVGDIENHEALIRAAMEEQSQKLAASKTERKRLKLQIDVLETKVANAKRNCERWQSRALREADQDKEKALLCLDRRQNVQGETNYFTKVLQETRRAYTVISEDILRCEMELTEVRQKHQILKTRESTREALGCTNSPRLGPKEKMSDVFDRWESRLGGPIEELDVDELDEFEQSYIDEEKRDELERELNVLCESSKADDVRS